MIIRSSSELWSYSTHEKSMKTHFEKGTKLTFRNIKVIKTTKIYYIMYLRSKSKMYCTSNVSFPTLDMVLYFYIDFYQFYSDSYKRGA
jgi:hypothetical protein